MDKPIKDELAEKQKEAIDYINKTIKEGGEIEKIWWSKASRMQVCMREKDGKKTVTTVIDEISN